MAGIWDFLNPNRKKKPEGNDLEAVIAPKSENFLSQFLPEDPDKRQALAKALIMGGANAMAAGGPSKDPTNLLSVLGAGLAGGVKGYDTSIEAASDASYKRAAVSANNLKLQQSALGQNLQEEFFKKWGAPGPGGYPPEALYDLQKMQLATGDEESARATQKQIQQLQQSGAEKGFVIGENGFKLAPGYGEGLFETEKQKGLGSAVGKNAEMTTDQKDYIFGQEDPNFTRYEKSKIPGLNPGTGKFLEESGKQAAERVAKAQVEAQGAQTLSADVQKMAEIARQIGSGKWAEMKNTYGPYLESVGIKVEGLSEGQLLESMTSRVGPSLRVPGSGASSDLDVTMFIKSIPSLSKSPEGNQLIADTTTAVANHKMKVAEIYRRTQNPEDELYGNFNEAEKQIAALPNPYSAFNEARKSSETTGSVGSESAPAANTGRIPVINSEAEFDALPPGASYRFPDETIVRQKR